MAELYRYAAFISYSSKDAKFAQRLHRALESYGIPSSLGKFDLIGGGGKQNRIYPVFRDREELSAGHLGDQIEGNLKASAALIVVCSPNSAASPWVQKEIEFFAAQGRHAKIFAIIPDTAPLTAEGGADATQSCFPPAFRGDALAGDKLEPLAADARRGKDGFRNAWLKIVAGMVGVTPGQIIDRDRSRRRERALGAAVIFAIALLSLGYAYAQRETLEPFFIRWTRYQPYAMSRDALMSAVPGTMFQDCRSGTGDCPMMVIVPEGTFLMGDLPDTTGALSESDQESVPDERRRIFVGRFAASQTEITFADWQACVAAAGCHGNRQPSDEGFGRGRRPVINVSWQDAKEYVRWLSQMTGHEYRLLTEAEWEYAARAQTSPDAPYARFSWGNENPVCDVRAPNGAAGPCEQPGTWPVASFQSNAFGLYDLHGNVWEWVEDCLAGYNPEQTTSAPVEIDNSALGDGDSCSLRVRRGGSWGASWPEVLQSTNRHGSEPLTRGDYLGFRVARTLAPVGVLSSE